MTKILITSIIKQLEYDQIDFTKPRLNENLKPWQVTGLVDGEGSFNYSLTKMDRGLAEYSIKLEFKVTQKTHSEGVLYELQKYFDCGSIVIDNRETDTKKFHITSLTDILEKIIPHFENYPCLTSKFLNFKDWKEIALIMNKKEHLNKKGMEKIRYITSKTNKNRSFEDKYNHCKSYLGLFSLPNGELSTTYNLPEYWVQTFLTSESMFYTYLAEKKSRGKIYQGCDSSLELGQSNHDIAILLSLKKFFNGGYIKPKYNFDDILLCKNSRSVNRYVLRDTQSIIKFVDKYPMLTKKQLDYLDWKQIVMMKEKGLHKTSEGLNFFKEIISNVNSKRD